MEGLKRLMLNNPNYLAFLLADTTPFVVENNVSLTVVLKQPTGTVAV